MSSSTMSPVINLSTAGKELPMTRRFNKVRSTLNVDEEYTKALRTKSYIDIWAKAQQQLNGTNSPNRAQEEEEEEEEEGKEEEEEEEEEKPTSPLSHPRYSHLPRFLLEPVQEAWLSPIADHLHLHSLLLDYFDATLQAFSACASLLACIDLARSHHSSLRCLLLNLSHSPTASSFADLAAFLDLDNPLSPRSLSHFNRTHAILSPLIRRLTSAHRRIMRRTRLIKMFKKASGIALVAACGAALVAALVVATHAAAVISVVPVVFVGPRAAVRWVRRSTRGLSEDWLATASMQVDAAAKGAYIVARDFDTMSQMVKRAEGEVEHGLDVGRMVVRNQERHLVRELAREVEGGKAGFLEQLGELEEHVYLCLLTINRSRRLVAQEMGCMAAVTSTMVST